MKRALIVGSGGQDGTLLGELLRGRGMELCGLNREGLVDASGKLLRPARLADAAEMREVVSAVAPERVYYLAAHHHSAQDAGAAFHQGLWQESLQVQVAGLVNILEALRLEARGARLFYASSSHIFDPNAPAPQSESTPRLPENVYGITKVTGMEACRLYRRQHGVFAAVGILYNHESILRQEKFLSQKIIRTALRIKAGQARELLLGDLSSRVDWGYAPDYVDAMSLILDLPEADDFIIATGEAHEVREFVQIVFDELGLDYRASVREDPNILRQSNRSLVGSASKLRQATGWKPSVSFAEMVRRLVSETRERIASADRVR